MTKTVGILGAAKARQPFMIALSLLILTFFYGCGGNSVRTFSIEEVDRFLNSDHGPIVFDRSDSRDTSRWEWVDSLDKNGMTLTWRSKPSRTILGSDSSSSAKWLHMRETMTYDSIPNVAECYEGRLSINSRLKILYHLNFLRSLHNLDPLLYNCDDDLFAQRGALIMAANNERGLNHFPDTSWHCWTPEGANGTAQSCLATEGFFDDEFMTAGVFITEWLIDLGSDPVGHRRWLLDPFARTVAFGRIDLPKIYKNGTSASFGALLIRDDDVLASPLKVQYVAYPFKDYPAALFDKEWFASFSVVADSVNYWNNNSVDFSHSTIAISDENADSVAVTSIEYDNQSYGLPNSLQWKMKALKVGRKYDVGIRNVQIDGVSHSYGYWFRLTKDHPIPY